MCSYIYFDNIITPLPLKQELVSRRRRRRRCVSKVIGTIPVCDKARRSRCSSNIVCYCAKRALLMMMMVFLVFVGAVQCMLQCLRERQINIKIVSRSAVSASGQGVLLCYVATHVYVLYGCYVIVRETISRKY